MKPQKKTTTVGQLVQCKVTVSPNSWSSVEESIPIELSIDSSQQWVVCGYTKRGLSLKKTDKVEFEIAIVPYVAGELCLPVIALKSSEKIACVYPSSGEQIVVYP
jgi:hypothetical protein